MRLDGFGIHAAEKRIARAADFFAGDFVAAEKVAQQAAAGAVHWINDEAEFRGAQDVPVDELVESFEVGGADVERMNQIWLRR